MKILTIALLCLAIPAGLMAQPKSDRVPTSIIVTGEAEVYYDAQYSVNGLVLMKHRVEGLAPFVFIKAGQEFSQVVVGPAAHLNRDGVAAIIAGGVGASRAEGQWAGHLKQYMAVAYRQMNLVFDGEVGGHELWVRTYVDGEFKPRKRLGLFYQSGVGVGPRLQLGFPTTTATVWLGINWDLDKEVFGFSYTF